MRGRKNPRLEIVSIPEGTPITLDIMAQSYHGSGRHSTVDCERARDDGKSPSRAQTRNEGVQTIAGCP